MKLTPGKLEGLRDGATVREDIMILSSPFLYDPPMWRTDRHGRTDER